LGKEVTQEEGDESLKIIVGKCQMSKCTFVHIVPQKGVEPRLYAVERIKRDILWLGHTKVRLKSDNESAILALLRNALKVFRVEDIESAQEGHSAAYDSSSNATTEAACRSMAGQIRTIRACLESRIKRRIPVTHCVFYWLVEHAAWLLTIRSTQSDGITPYKRLRGLNFSTRMLGFGESCLYRVPKKSPEASLDGKLSPNWKSGIFLGYSRDSNEFVMWNVAAKAIIRTRSVQRKSESDRWDVDGLVGISQRPMDTLYRATATPTGWREPSGDFEQRLAPEDEAPRTRPSVAPDLRVTVKDLEDFGYTEVGCQRCDFIRQHGDARRCGYAHSTICRERIKGRLNETAEGRLRLGRVEARLSRNTEPRAKTDPYPEMSIPPDTRNSVYMPRDSQGVDEQGEEDVEIEVDSDAKEQKDDAMATGTCTPTADEKNEGNPDTDMGLLEHETPVERLVSLSREESEDAVRQRADWGATRDIAVKLLWEGSAPPVISQLPNSAKEELAQEMSAMFEEAECLGANINQNIQSIRDELHVIVSEIYSPPRVTRAARILKKLNITPGFAMDITTHDAEGRPWDFDQPQQKTRAVRLIYETEPDLIVGSPMCKDFSAWQRLNKAKSSEPEKYDQAKDHS